MLEIKNISKTYGKIKGIEYITFGLKKNEVVGFIGPNGAGKSTTMNIITGCLSVDSGSIEADGIDINENPVSFKKMLGYLPEQTPLYNELTVTEFLKTVLKIKKIRTESAHISNLIEDFGLSNVKNRVIAKPEQKGMRTTAVGCIVDNKELTYFNSGDSRFYFFSNGTLSTMTKDHSVSQMSVELGEMSFDDIRFDADRNKLLKVLGESTTNEVGTIYRPIPYKKGDAFLLCSDGFWEYVLEEEMEIDLSKSETAKEWIEFMLVRLLLKFNGNNDNFTVVGGIIK